MYYLEKDKWRLSGGINLSSLPSLKVMNPE
jgi:hypothetical protein